MNMLECIAETFEDAVAIEKGGGDRIELISSLKVGGLTPSYGLVKKVIEEVKIPVNIMLRPHAKSFVYSKEDLEIMKEDARVFHELGAKQVVLGMLTPEGLPDLEALEYVLEDTNLLATFHRAIDVSADLLTSLKLLTSCRRVTHVLTSGGPGRAADHLPLLKVMVKESEDLIVIVGSGIQEENLLPIRKEIDFYLENGNGRKPYDIHVGTGVRGGSSENPVSQEEVKKLAILYHSL